VLRPDGEPGIYGVVHTRFQAIGVVALTEAGDVVLVGQHRYTLDVYSWEIPEGGGRLDEDAAGAAKRELSEETGYMAATWRVLTRFSLSNSVMDERGIVFLATDLTAGASHPEGSEDITVRELPLEEALSWVEDGTIHDGVSQIGLLATARLLHR
jgi:8-oxo-dGTP pyrophosphatase MutT (NUDIX family)